jgi:hypothetical protein
VNRNYRAIKRGAGPSGGTLLRLIREDAEASLCGIPQSSLSRGGLFDEMICPDCIEWLPKRAKASPPFRTVDRSGIPPE